MPTSLVGFVCAIPLFSAAASINSSAAECWMHALYLSNELVCPLVIWGVRGLSPTAHGRVHRHLTLLEMLNAEEFDRVIRGGMKERLEMWAT